MSAQTEVSDLELARVSEIPGSENCRWFDATLQDGSRCRVSVVGDDLRCHRHGVQDCEGCRRVLFVLTGEKKKALGLTLLGYELGMSEEESKAVTPSRSLSLTR